MIKKLLFLLFLSANISLSQGTDVLNAEQFCSGTSKLVFNNTTGSPDNTQVGCLGSIPNASYFYMEIDNPGNLIFTITQQDIGGTPIDVDFIAWGPFTDLNDADNTIAFQDCAICPNNTVNPNFYPYNDTNPNPDSPIVDCSYDIAAAEQMSILNAMQGEIYVVLITNYNGAQGTIDFQQTGGTGTTTCASLPVCGSQFYDSGSTVGPYANNESITTTINAYLFGGTVEVEFTMLDITDNDEITVYDGPNGTGNILGTITNTTAVPITFISTNVGNPTGAISFLFESDGAGFGNGWIADITCIPPPTPPTCGLNFYDNGGASGDYSNNWTETTTFYPETAGDAVTATFNLFDIESCCDELYVYDGPDTGSPLIGVYAGNTIPGPFTSSHASGALTFMFVSDSSVTYSGWDATLTCAPYVAPTVCGSTFYDSGGAGGNYLSNEFTTTTLTPDITATAVVVTFTSFDLESCCDDLLVYDGPDATYPLLGTFSGSGLPGPFTSTDPSGALTFVFDSDFSVQLSGWVADVTCVSTCNVVITDTAYPIGASDCTLDYTELVATGSEPSTSRTTVWSENFNGAGLPAGWNTVNATANTLWIISNSSNAGGTANEAMLDWDSGTTDVGTWTLTSPSIPIAGETNLELDYRQYLRHFSSSYAYSIYVETNVDGSGWVTQSSNLNVAASIGPNAPIINLSALSGNNLQIRFRMNGNPFGFFYWTIDDIILTADGTPIVPQISWSPATDLYTDNTLATPYVLGNFTGTVYADPASTITYTATENPSLCTATVVVVRGGNIWLGITDDWNTGSNWSFGTVPTKNEEVIIPDLGASANYPILVTGAPLPPPVSRAGCLTIEYNATIEIKNNGRLIVTDGITVDEGATLPDLNGKLLIRSGGNLVQLNDGAVNTNNNSGNIKIQRSVTGVNPDSYVYWSSPVEGFDVGAVSPNTTGFIFEWDPTTSVAIPYGNWISPSPTIMSQGKGYIIKDLIGTTPEDGTVPPFTAPIATTSEFIGVPRNGELTTTIFRGDHLPAAGDYAGAGNTMATPNDDNWNLIGNPYPSSISADAFIATNAGVIEVESGPVVFGTIWLWVHQNSTSLINDPFYGDYVYNYNGNQYTAYNMTGPNPAGFNGYIASGQGFFVLMQDIAGPTLSTDITFRNSMRYEVISGDEVEYDNNNFLRTSSNETDTNIGTERHRIWLDLIRPNDNATSILVGYIEGATNTADRLFDGHDLNKTGTRLYSLIDNEEFSIQGKTLPFDQEDRVPLGVTITENAMYQIAINTLDGLFENEAQAIYLEDTYTNTIHDLRSATYSFTSEIGTFNDRFILRYTDQTLGVNPIDGDDGIIISTPKSEYVKVNSELGAIDIIYIYDILGRVIFNTSNINSSEFVYRESNLSDGAYIVKVELVNGKQKIQKVVLRQ